MSGHTGSTTDVPFREIPYLPQKLNIKHRNDGSVILTNGHPLRPVPSNILAPIVYWGATDPQRTWLAQRDPLEPEADRWIKINYGDGLKRIRRLAAGLLKQGAGPEAPLMILSRNSIEHALIYYAAVWAGSPVVPMTPAYSLLSQDFSRLLYAKRLIEPKLVFAEDADEFGRAFNSLAGEDVRFVSARNAEARSDTISLDDIEAEPDEQVDFAFSRLHPQMVAKYMLTSGSTGEPKAVINTHGMIAANAKMIRSVWDVERLSEVSPGQQVMVNFLPWSHTFGAHAILHSMTDWGGALYIDWGAPTPDRLPEMIRNLRDVSPTQHTTVPAAWAALATELENDDEFARNFFKRLLVMSYGGAAMGQDIYERIQNVAVRITGQRISLSAGYGATETAPTVSNVHWPSSVMGLIGLPIPGCEMKLAPIGDKLECRVKGPNITPGYLKNPEKTAEAFDEEGYYKLGDAVKFKDPENPKAGLAFDGRITEEFKLSNGSWVSAGGVRISAIQSINGALSDAVVCGLNETYISILGILDQNYCNRLVGEELSVEELSKHPKVIEVVRDGLIAQNQKNRNVSSRVAACIIQTDIPTIDSGEVTDKRYLNQNKARDLRKADIDRIYSGSNDPDIIRI